MKPKLSENKMLAFRTEEVHVQLVPVVQKLFQTNESFFVFFTGF